jgi:quinol monooxygenase YgiN
VAGALAMHIVFSARRGEGDALAAILLEAAESAREIAECRLYLVGCSPANSDKVWVTEVWTSRDAYLASLEDERVQAMVARAVPLLVGPPQPHELTSVAGTGL